jgi:DNA-directed RNA polymerase subunit RPC12/RpoP
MIEIGFDFGGCFIGTIDGLTIGLLMGVILGLIVIIPICISAAKGSVNKAKGNIKCPSCGSNNLEKLSRIVNKHSGISIPKGIAGGLLFGKIGALGGVLLGSDKPVYEKYYHCRDCGHKWK